jgi:hypothetical protein
MELQQLNNKLKNLEKEYELKRRAMVKEYCDANNPYKVGDKFTDHIGSIIIETINYSQSISSNQEPACVYYGPELKKDGTPKVNGTKRKAYQINDSKKQ